jgi:hypothetical protein
MVIAQQFALTFRNFLALSFIVLSVSACAGSDTIDLQANKNVNDAIEAATGPLQDLNLRRQEIPPLLVKATMDPYARAKKIKCAELRDEVVQLDELLGPDVERKSITLASSDGGLVDNIANFGNVEMPETMSLAEGAGNLAKDALMSTIRSKTNILPFRSIIRSVTGANRHAKKLAAAYEAGKLRRAYLKGLADVRFGEKCSLAPIVVEAKADTTAAQ